MRRSNLLKRAVQYPAPEDFYRAAVSIVATYEIEQHQYRILLVACEALDRREQARTLLKKHGLTFEDSKGMIRQRPEVYIERDSSTAFLRALRALKLEAEAP